MYFNLPCANFIRCPRAIRRMLTSADHSQLTTKADKTTLNIVAPTMLGVVASVLAVVCKRMQQLPTMLRPAVHRGNNTTCVAPLNNVGRAVQTDPALLRCASAITEQKRCLDLLAEKFDRFQTLRNNMQQGVQTDATCNRPTMLGVVGQKCCVRLHAA